MLLQAAKFIGAGLATIGLAGAGVGIEPIGFLVTKGDHISFLEAGKTHGLAALFEKVPDLVEKIIKERNKESVEA